MATWRLTKDLDKPGGVISTLPNCGYDEYQLKSLIDAGYSLYCEGELIKGPEDGSKRKRGPKKRKVTR